MNSTIDITIKINNDIELNARNGLRIDVALYRNYYVSRPLEKSKLAKEVIILD